MKLKKYLGKLWRADYPASLPGEAEASWERFAAKAFDNKPVKVFRMKPYWKHFAAAAAAVVLLVVSLQLVIDARSGPDFLSVENTGKTIRVVTLPDRSVISLLPGSRLQYAENFRQNRTLNLDGEAYFEVTKKEGAPFRVTSGRTTTTVLGTSFNVKSRVDGSTEVALYEGRVKMEVEGMEQDWKLSPGELFIFNGTGPEVVPFNTRRGGTPLYIDFEKAPLAEIAAYIKDVYGYTVTGDPAIFSERMTMRVRRNEPLDNILKTITDIYDMGSSTDTLRNKIELFIIRPSTKK
ncbi:ferric-dicitrate binding protein FerR, regulates iron transport through sigma-19 [Parapedobacter composti]|uniref:Ferric-dicitrate binding protein FerR, regulates iron transport through sigma-19 n=1 Tax=Parapedobacter composti TaxID=623281 RepID=A0A1I1LZ34_9SPHI|nr:FecR domain-containing protein [Parapedobacter composti]SFC78507.1 ferric-dicitrate binding protein FerR, regulates iron transport through sigma-19 [Parapedobacter composti]